MLRAFGCLAVLGALTLWALATYYPMGYLLGAFVEDGPGPEWLWVGAVFAWVVIVPVLLAYVGFRGLRPMR